MINEMPEEELSGGNQVRKDHVRIEAEESFQIVCGESSIKMDKYGNITIVGMNINISGSDKVMINGIEVDLLTIGQPNLTHKIGRN